jgi:hypothetical protein
MIPDRPYRDQRDYLETMRRDHELAIDRNCRILELAKHNGFSIETHPTRCGEYRIWNVPREFGAIAGAMALLVR